MSRTQISLNIGSLDRQTLDKLMNLLGDVSQNEAIVRAIHATTKVIELQNIGCRIVATKPDEIPKELIIF
ncbi:MAG: hypothetical protein JNJ45_05365 [Chthonomonas sp.]|nr:hypothetical protein [Chthonomonas sp.]